MQRSGVFDDSSRLNIRQRESPGEILSSFRFDDRFFEHFAVKLGNRSVWTNGAGFDPGDTFRLFHEWYLDVGILSSLFGQDLDPDIGILVPGAGIVVTVHLAVENDGRRARSQRLGSHS